ncbi:ATP-binding protein [[Clostridium] polysaccharolyticum]|uniref:Uncharacterized protein n=1 Tax=[Clostridium] polysaccharolyticum TaxID=29364 RepID=A0A1I0FM82_9FIRM|nr:ATP-binding protein [[Clostridium] polysaccharolyticum]SET59168.1 hypothetical protein SAMN04487772_13322 [[Clostridium] polysaccharolyticum]
MYKEVNQLIIYRNFDREGILHELAAVCETYESGDYNKKELVAKIYEQMNCLLDVATRYGFDKNLWHNYIAYSLVTDENPFSIVCEKHGKREGSVLAFALSDFENIYRLFHYDFSKMEQALGISCFQIIEQYQAIQKKERSYNKSVSEKVRALSEKLETAKDAQDFLVYVTDFYKSYGVGKFGLNKAFRIKKKDQDVVLAPILNTDMVKLDDLIGYEIQKQKLIDNTKAFVEGKKSNNVLLTGDSGTGKSTSIKAILNEFYDQGLRMIEIYKHQFQDLSTVIEKIKDRNYRFIIYMDDLSFEEFEIEYKYLKAIIEGGLETKPDNVLIYATSNRRHLIRETWGDRNDGTSNEELHRSETMQEKLSLVNRFGVTISYSKPDQKEYFNIVTSLAKRYPDITLTEQEICMEANKWELSHGGMSGRTAQQFINYLAGKYGVRDDN